MPRRARRTGRCRPWPARVPRRSTASRARRCAGSSGSASTGCRRTCVPPFWMPGDLLPLVELDLVRRRSGSAGPSGRASCAAGKAVEGDLLAAVGPERVAGDLREHLEAVHELDDAAGLEALPRDRRSRGGSSRRRRSRRRGTGRRGPSPSGSSARRRRGASGRCDCRQYTRRLAEALGDVHVVPVEDAGGPVGHVGGGSSRPGRAATARRCGCRASRRSRGCRPRGCCGQ